MKLNQIILTLFTGMSLLFAQSINTQGVLRDGNGYALDDGSYELTFRIYDAETGGTVKWTGNYPTVTVTNGVFNATLGDESNPVDMLDGSASYWMSIEIGSDGEMSPRLKLNTSAYEMAYLSGSENVFPGAGNVGIGTTSPGSKLHVNGNARVGDGANLTPDPLGNGHLEINGNGYSGFISLDGSAMYLGHNSSSRRLDLMTNETSRVSITSNGNVGIGTASPKAGLEVFDDNGAIISSDITTGSRTATLRLGSPYQTNHDAYCAKITSTNDQSLNYNSDLRFYTSIGNNASATERMSILSNGNVGIGATSPSARLEVSGDTHTAININATTSPRVKFMVNDATVGYAWAYSDYIGFGLGDESNSLFVASNGNVGIGTTTPTKPLTINGAGYENPIRINNAQASNANANSILNDADNITLLMGGVWSNSIYFYWKDENGNKYKAQIQGVSFNGRSEMGAEIENPTESRLQSQEERIAGLEAELAEIKALLKAK